MYTTTCVSSPAKDFLRVRFCQRHDSLFCQRCRAAATTTDHLNRDNTAAGSQESRSLPHFVHGRPKVFVLFLASNIHGYSSLVRGCSSVAAYSFPGGSPVSLNTDEEMAHEVYYGRFMVDSLTHMLKSGRIWRSHFILPSSTKMPMAAAVQDLLSEAM